MVMKKKLLKFIKKHGILTTIIQTGGYDNFNDIFPDYFKNRDHKVDLINAIVDNNEDGDYIYMYEINGMDIKIWEEEIEDGHTQEDYITFVGDETVGVSVYEYDEEGDMYDEEIDGYNIKLTQLKEVWLNKIFEILVGYYL
jgi:hypothetical protein